MGVKPITWRFWPDVLRSGACDAGVLSASIDADLIAEMTWDSYVANYRHAIFDGWTVEALRDRVAGQIDILLDGYQADGAARASDQPIGYVARDGGGAANRPALPHSGCQVRIRQRFAAEVNDAVAGHRIGREVSDHLFEHARRGPMRVVGNAVENASVELEHYAKRGEIDFAPFVGEFQQHLAPVAGGGLALDLSIGDQLIGDAGQGGPVDGGEVRQLGHRARNRSDRVRPVRR